MNVRGKYLFYLLNELLITYMFIVFFFVLCEFKQKPILYPITFCSGMHGPPPPCLEGSFAISLKVAKLRCFLSLDPVDIKTVIPIKY